MSDMSTILRALISRTEEGKLNWKTTVDNKAFVAAVDTTGVIIKMMDDFLETHRLEILNDKGLTAVVLETDSGFGKVPEESRATDEQIHYLRRLFVLARESALDANTTLEKLALDLERIR